MQAVLRSGLGEVARGVSTGIVTWAARNDCNPVLTCAPCPECSCGSIKNINGVGPVTLGCAVLLAIVLGYLFGWYRALRNIVSGAPVPNLERVQGQGQRALTVAEEARAQVALIRRNGSSSGNRGAGEVQPGPQGALA